MKHWIMLTDFQVNKEKNMRSGDIIITGNRAIARSYAKINLTLDVLSRREDGYHNVEMIMQTVSLFDSIVIDKTDSDISITTNLYFLPTNDKNIAYKAAALFFEYTHCSGGCRIMIHKNIPVAAGLAGGSGNAAVVLCALNLLFNTGLSIDTLCELGLKLGADVPYCIKGGTMLASGIGEVLLPLPELPDCVILMVKPQLNISTAAVYEQIDNAPIRKRPDIDIVKNALKNGNIKEIASNMYNVMGSVTESSHPIVRGIRNKMLKNGALGAVMSGSGPTVFGIFPDYDTAKRSHDSFAYQFKEVFIVHPV